MTVPAGYRPLPLCAAGEEPFDPKPDVRSWLRHKLRHPSWRPWRDENPEDVRAIAARLGARG